MIRFKYDKGLLLLLVLVMVPHSWSFYLWKLKEWSPCSVTCGEGSTKAIFGCFNIISENFVSESFCQSHKIIKFQKFCRIIQECPQRQTKEGEGKFQQRYKGYWLHSEFGACTTSCGRGVKSRRVMCISHLTFDLLDDSQCPADEQPVGTILCGNKECRVIADWMVGSWSKCSSTICDGVQIRNVTCEERSNAGKITLDRHCLKEQLKKPLERKSCSQPCLVWVAGDWGKCRKNKKSKKCVIGKQARCVQCVDRRSMKVVREMKEDKEKGDVIGYCSNGERPLSRRGCNFKSC